ncbi:MAG: helix-turn-helix domain-containing protein [Gaiellaceae bacterium]
MPTGSWELLVRQPDARLRGDVLVLEDYAEHVTGPLRQRHLPPPFVPLIVNFGPPYLMLDPLTSAVAAEHGSFTGGLGEAVAVTESPGSARCVQVNLTPLGARQLFGVPMHELTDRVVSVADLLGREADRLEERLAETPDAGARLSLVESFLHARLAGAAPPRPDVAYAWRRLAETGGSLRIGALAAELGCSRKHLAEQFRDQLGLPPKAVARLVRFNRALRLVERGLDGAEVAFRCGYADQAHFVKEFRRFSGSTPAAFARDPEVPFLQAVDDVAA